MDITVQYTDEEKVLFDEVFRLKGEVRLLEDEIFLVRREKQEHTQANHTDGIPPIVFMVISCLNILLFAADLIVGFGTLDLNVNTIADPQMHGQLALSIALAAGTPTLAVIFAILFVVSYRKYFFQVTKDPKMQKKAEELNIKNYHVEEARIDARYEEISRRYNELKVVYERKNAELEALVERRTRETNEEREKERKERRSGNISVVKRESVAAEIKKDTEEKSGSEEKSGLEGKSESEKEKNNSGETTGKKETKSSE